MINHARTLLMNVDSDGTFTPYVGEEIIPPFKALELPTFVNAIRAQLFGQAPDRYMLNYRVRQLMALLHSSPLEEYVTALDPRITYALDGYDWPDSSFVPQVMRSQGTESDSLTVLGRPVAPDKTGQCYSVFTVSLLSHNSVQVTRQTPNIQNVVFDLTMTDGLSNQIPLVGTGYSFVLTTDNPGQVWRIWSLTRPQVDLSQLAAAIGQIGEPNLDALFGITNVEPYITFSNLWFRKRELPLKLGALLCALIYRSEERRLNGA